jgi:cytoskeletal protein CcmA (bactofilin family)
LILALPLLRFSLFDSESYRRKINLGRRNLPMALWNQPAQEGSNDKAQPSQPISSAASVISTPATPVTPIVTPKESAARDRRNSVFGPGVTIEGKIEGDADVHIAGKFKGDIHIKGDFSVEKGAHVAAKIDAANVTIGGEVDGNIVASAQVKLLEGGQLIGDLKAATLTVAAGSRMRGNVEFGWSATEAAKFNGHAHAKDKAGAAG